MESKLLVKIENDPVPEEHHGASVHVDEPTGDHLRYIEKAEKVMK